MDAQEKITQAKEVLINLIYNDWITNHLFSPTWLGTVIFILLSYALCFKLLDKHRLTQILLFGSLITVMITLFDIIGVEYTRWAHLTRILPIMPTLFLFDFTIMPLYYMLIYQYCSNWKSYTIWNAIAAGLISFVFFPLLTALRMFELLNWRYAYFFPCIFTFGLVSRAIVVGVVALENKRIGGLR
jgi:hypothetical protein